MPESISSRARTSRMARDTFAILKRWFWLLGLCALLGGVGAFVGSKLTPPTYRATTLLVAGQQSSGSDLYNGVLASTQLIPTYMSLLTQPVVLQRAAAQVGGVTAQQLASQTHVTDQAGTQIIELDVDDTSPVRAARLANAIAADFIDMQRQGAAATLAQEQQQANQQLAQVSTEIRTLNSQINTLRAQDPASPKLQGLEQQLSVALSRQSALQTTSDQLAAQAITSTSAISVFQAATPPPAPDHPKPLLNAAIGAALGLVIAAALVWLLEFFDGRIRTPNKAEALLDLPVIGSIGTYPRPALLPEVTASRKLSMDFQALVTKLEMAHIDDLPRSIAVTSATNGEGSTTTAINLAISLARKGKRVLLVDGDLHQPVEHESQNEMRQPRTATGSSHLGIQELLESPVEPENTFGLSLALTTQAYDAFEIPAVPDVRGLYVFPAGPRLKDASEVIRSDRIRHFLKWQLDDPAGMQFDIIVLDTPPADIYPDTARIVRWVDATILVVDATRSNEQTVLRVKDMLERAHASIAGVVLNRAPSQEYKVRFAKMLHTTQLIETSDPMERMERQNACAGHVSSAGRAHSAALSHRSNQQVTDTVHTADAPDASKPKHRNEPKTSTLGTNLGTK